MQHSSFIIRKASREDHRTLLILYRLVAREAGGIARTESEISEQYIFNIIDKAVANGLILVAFDDYLKIVVGCIHASKPAPGIFDHVLTDLTILVHPSCQGMGTGTALFKAFLSTIESQYPDILRVELFCKASNKKALRIYEKLGFVLEGRFHKRVKEPGNSFETDIAMAWFNPSFDRRRPQTISQDLFTSSVAGID